MTKDLITRTDAILEKAETAKALIISMQADLLMLQYMFWGIAAGCLLLGIYLIGVHLRFTEKSDEQE